MTTSPIDRPGGTNAHHAPWVIAVRSNACSSIVPHETPGTPTPRKASADSSKIA